MHKQYYVYILSNQTNAVLYIGVTNNLKKRVWQHKEGSADSFTKDYKVNKLVYYDIHENPESAIRREKQLKAWRRSWKEDLISKNIREWKDLYADLLL